MRAQTESHEADPLPVILRCGAAASKDDGDRLRTHHRSREAFALRALFHFPSHPRGSGAPTGARVLERTPSRASDAGPQALARRLASPRRSAHAVHASGGRSPLGAPRRRFLGSGGVAGRLPGVGYEPTRRTPVPPCSCRRDEHPGGRDDRRINLDAQSFKEFQRCEQFACWQPVDACNAEDGVSAVKSIEPDMAHIHSDFLRQTRGINARQGRPAIARAPSVLRQSRR